MTYLKIISALSIFLVPLISRGLALVTFSESGGKTIATFNQAVIVTLTGSHTGEGLLAFQNTGSNDADRLISADQTTPTLFGNNFVSMQNKFTSGGISNAFLISWNGTFTPGNVTITSSSAFELVSTWMPGETPATIQDGVTMLFFGGSASNQIGTAAVVPEPSTYAMLLGLGMLSLITVRRFKKCKA